MAKRKPLDTAAFASAAIPRPDPVEAATAHAPVPTKPADPSQTSREGRVQIQGYFPNETRRRLKTLAAGTDRTVEDILGEAIADVLAKYSVT